MLHLHHADRLEPLLDALADVLAPAPLDPFQPDLVVVPAAGMDDAVRVGLGGRLSVMANVEFMFPGRFMARALGEPVRGGAGSSAGSIGGDLDLGDPWRLPQLTWWVLDELAVTTAAVPGRSTDGSGWFALARRIADLFDRYATQRPKLIEEWAAGRALDGTMDRLGAPAALQAQHLWQFHLWQGLRARIGTPSPPERLPGLLEGIRSGAVQPALPERVALFGLGSVPPATFAVLRALGASRDLHLFLRHPSHVAWQHSQHGLRGSLSLRDQVDVASHTNHPLLPSWGRMSLEARALVGDAPEMAEHAEGVGAPEAPRTVLQAVQAGVRADQSPVLSAGLSAADGSLQVHACHGIARQLESLRDALGHAFAADPTLQPHDVLVLCPDLEAVAPLIDAVFQRGTMPVPVRIGDRSLTTEDPIGGVLATVLQLVAGRATLSEVLALVQYEPVRRRFGWDLGHVEQLAEWCIELGTRWGLTAEHRPEWGVSSEVTVGTWRSMTDQLLAGMAMPAPAPRAVMGDVAPFDDLGTDQFHLVGGLADLLARLLDLHAAAVLDAHGEPVRMPVADWVTLLHDVLDGFAAVERDDEWRLRGVHRSLDAIAEAAAATARLDLPPVRLTLADIRSAVGETLRDRPGRLPLRSGAVTVSSLVPQHGVPARVVCLVGLDDGTLRGGTFDGDDALGVHPCVGERHPRFEGRQLLLDAVLSAGERFIVTCNGADLTSNKLVPFVVPLAELLDVVRHTVALEAGDAPVVVRHPRHGFNEKALVPGALWPVSSGAFTFDPSMLQAAQARREAMAAGAGPEASSLALPAVERHEADLDDLVKALTRTAEVYLRDRLDVGTAREAATADDQLPLTVAKLHEAQMGADLLDRTRRDQPLEEWHTVVRLDGTLPPQELATPTITSVRDEVNNIAARASHMGVALGGGDDVSIDLSLQRDGQPPLALTGTVHGVQTVQGRPTVVEVRFTRDRSAFRLAMAVRVAALQLQVPDAAAGGVMVVRHAKDGAPVVHEVAMKGEGDERLEHARAVLRLAAEVLAWASRDAVPLFPRCSEVLHRANAQPGPQFTSDCRDQYVAMLWSNWTIDDLRRAPVHALDPLPVQHIATQHDWSRAVATARWVWGEFDTHVEARKPAAPRKKKAKGDDS